MMTRNAFYNEWPIDIQGVLCVSTIVVILAEHYLICRRTQLNKNILK